MDTFSGALHVVCRGVRRPDAGRRILFFEALCRLLSSVPGANGQLDACFGTMGRWDVERGHGVDSRQNAYYNTRRQKKASSTVSDKENGG